MYLFGMFKFILKGTLFNLTEDSIYSNTSYFYQIRPVSFIFQHSGSLLNNQIDIKDMGSPLNHDIESVNNIEAIYGPFILKS